MPITKDLNETGNMPILKDFNMTANHKGLENAYHKRLQNENAYHKGLKY